MPAWGCSAVGYHEVINRIRSREFIGEPTLGWLIWGMQVLTIPMAPTDGVHCQRNTHFRALESFYGYRGRGDGLICLVRQAVKGGVSGCAAPRPPSARCEFICNPDHEQ